MKIRPNETFHNGEACTAEDVFFTFDRCLQGFGDGTVRVLYETLDKVEIIDDLTVRFYLNRPDAAFENRLGSVWGANIVPKDYLEEIGAEAFQTRCPHCMDKCKSCQPKLREVEPDHYVACHLFEEGVEQ